MKSLILYEGSRLILPLQLLFSVFLTLRGHYEPGGGFIGGLIAASAFALYTFSAGLDEAKKALRVHPIMLMSFGLFLAFVSGVPALFVDTPYLTGIWIVPDSALLDTVGTPLVFDLGVYFTVIGVMLLIIFDLAEE